MHYRHTIHHGLCRDQHELVPRAVVIKILPFLSVFFWLLQKGLQKIGKGKATQKGNYGRMLALAAHALAEVFEMNPYLNCLNDIETSFS